MKSRPRNCLAEFIHEFGDAIPCQPGFEYEILHVAIKNNIRIAKPEPTVVMSATEQNVRYPLVVSRLWLVLEITLSGVSFQSYTFQRFPIQIVSIDKNRRRRKPYSQGFKNEQCVR